MSDAAELLTLSQNETESLCMKAARGVGFSWGLAEEAGFAAGWLAARNFDAITPLVALLTPKMVNAITRGAPKPMPAHWRTLDGNPLCPIQLGAALIDHAELSDGPFRQETQIDPVERPILLLPFFARAAEILRRSVTVVWAEGGVQIMPDGVFKNFDAMTWASTQPVALRILTSECSDSHAGLTGSTILAQIPVATLRAIDALALRTTVPGSNSSRSGAGSSVKNDD